MNWEQFLSVVTIIAIVLGPVLALYIQRKLDTGRASRERKLQIFRTLVAHRATRLSTPFVEALNAIEVEFYPGENDDAARVVIEAWREFCDHLNGSDASTPAQLEAWNQGRPNYSRNLFPGWARTLATASRREFCGGAYIVRADGWTIRMSRTRFEN